jgi:prephenate dehydratase/chorismate mutase
MEMSDAKLETLRRRIDLLDARLVRLLDERMELALRIKRYKTEIVVPERERDVIENAAQNAKVMSADFARQLYRQIIDEAVRLQSRDAQLVGFQGEHGAWSELAIRAWSPEAVAIPCVQFADVFESVRSGVLDFGVVPVENSIAGAVSGVDDLLIEAGLSIVGEIRVPIHHCLCALPESDYRDIRIVYSHPMALSQCHGFITRNRLEARAWYDTAGAARMLAHERPRAAAAIASEHSARLYGLEILKHNVEDSPSNSTRFVVLAREPLAEGGDKCSICFTTEHRAGALFEVLALFSEAGVNLTRIESRPVRANPGTFTFLLDLQGSDRDPTVAALLEAVRARTDGFRLLGCYPEARG